MLQCRIPEEGTVLPIVLTILKNTIICIYSWLEALVTLFIPKRRKSVCGEIVLITGAGHGLGRATAYEFAKRQSTLVLWDINKQGVEKTAEECRKVGAIVHGFVVNCKNREEIYTAADKVKRDVGDVSILVNNAGVITTTKLLSTKDEQIQDMFDVNILAHYWTTKAFLPAMIKNNHGHIVTVASISGHVGIPFTVTYTSSKFAAVGFHDSLKAELRFLGKDGIQTTCLCPSIINTGFFKMRKTLMIPVLSAEDTAKDLMEGILTNQKMVFSPSWIKFILNFSRFLPERAYNAILDSEKISYYKLL
ncbi:17-beta-hydroxysteroid dehydrogenase 13-like [Sceloporus undulatus]|uniref:17-beta-hydroxysteroid dehydrogenase 13-like n=1 Tax=Sceloporus undulatus TaxID=8520 RepID=UPI001C4AC467|nr:17-beta-hydroxysteroid dehydrogenase 13-like [Sceloporus undulatus]